ncbi:MAG TPA: chromate transporter [Bacillota bacterium]|jgi:chromate transporter|nr:chromate transporter [Clostridia bacterium]MBP6949296.1 chromate transporter [Clostridia bacterium]NMA35807.1 chromate transporter [Clostridiaceae bacterium]HPY64796.1 chromate transporter [Bacillota bacterium]HQC48989.1 chromate transporter [Bacillota bacterium]
MSLWKFFLKIFAISMMTFGGGYTIVPLIREEFAHKEKLIRDDEMLELIALSQTAPGPIAVSTALLTGYKLKGRRGAIVGIVAAILPPLIIISILYYFYTWFAANFWVRAALRGMSGAISAIMVVAVYDLAKASLKEHKVFSAIILIAAFLTSTFTSINTGLIILALALVGIVAFRYVPKEKKP